MGVFITRGMTIGIPDGGLTIGVGEDGNISANLTLHVYFDVCSTWIELSLRHVEEAKQRRVEREDVWAGTDEEQKAVSLEREFEASMQAIMAAAIALDAFYANLQSHVQLSPDLIKNWQISRTARYKQVTEVLKRAFTLKPTGTAKLRQNLKEIYRLRDLTVHPTGDLRAPIWHPEINQNVEWRFAYFRSLNAEQVVNAATWIIWELAHWGTPKNKPIAEYLTGLRQRLLNVYPNGHPIAPTIPRQQVQGEGELAKKE